MASEGGRPGQQPGRAADLLPDPRTLIRLWQSASAMMCVQHFDGYLEFANPAYRKLFGWSADELRSVPFWEFVHPDDQHPLVEDRQRLIDGSSDGLVHETRMLGRNGTYRWTWWTTDAVPDQEVLFAVGFALTGSGRRPPGRVQVGSWAWDVSTDDVTWSEEVSGMFGRPRGSELSVSRFLEVVHDRDRARVDRALRWSLASGEPFTEVFHIVQPGGGVRRLRSSGRVTLGADGEPVRMRGLAWDLTDPGL